MGTACRRTSHITQETNKQKKITFHYLLRKFQIKDTVMGDGYNVNEKVMIHCCDFIFEL